MNRLTLCSSALVAGLVVTGMSCDGNIVRGDASGSSSGAGAGSGSGAGTGSGTGGASATGATSSTGVSSGAGTSSGASSSTGSSGAPCSGPGTVGWIDGMDDGDGKIDPTDGRKGSWYTFNDATAGATQTPAAKTPFTMTAIPASAPAPLAGHTMAANTFGSGFDAWGAAMAFDFNNDGITYGSYDASKFQGVCLWARVGPKADAGGRTIRLRFLDANTTPQGGVCDPSPSSGPNQCYDGFGADLALTPTWQVFILPWSSLAQQGWGKVAPAIAADKLYSLDFDTGASDAFDTWVFGVELF
jgi:hypothetical protein